MNVAPAAFQRAHVLIADPDADTRELHALTLGSLTDDVEQVGDGADALAAAMSRPPSLVVAELQLPRIDGFTLCRMLRDEPKTRSAQILIVTGTAAERDRHRALAAGADAVLVKPASPEQVREAARRLLLSARQLREHPLRPHAKGAAGRDRSHDPFDPADGLARRAMSRSYTRDVTTTPPELPPALTCPACFTPLVYERSHVGGVSARHPEQWDYYSCPNCGTFQYRHRTRKLRKV